MNCTTTMNTDVVIWIINDLQYYWSDFNDLHEYTYDSLDNSLTINHSPRTLDGASFQCVVNHQTPSATGYLTVISPTQPISVSPDVQSTHMHILSKIFTSK